MTWIWSALLTAIGITGWYFVMRKRWWGWGISLAVQGLWIAYAFATRQLPFLASAALYGAIAFKGLRRWHADAKLKALYGDLPHARPDVTVSRQIAPWAAQAVIAARQRANVAEEVMLDHRLAYDPARCLGCSWQPEKVAAAYTIEDQHQGHVERQVFEGIRLAGIEAPAWA